MFDNSIQQPSNAAGTEELILKAAEQEFLCKGFAGSRTTSIAQKAGVSHAMLHYYFRTKEKLFEVVIAGKLNLLKEIMLTSLSSSDKPLPQRLAAAIESHLDFLAANPTLPRLMINILNEGNQWKSIIVERLKESASQVVTELQHLIDEGAQRGECRHVDASTLLLDIISLNIFSFLAFPYVNVALDGIMDNMQHFIEQRKRHNVSVIMRELEK